LGTSYPEIRFVVSLLVLVVIALVALIFLRLIINDHDTVNAFQPRTRTFVEVRERTHHLMKESALFASIQHNNLTRT
jgi:hypothetical protein